MTTKCPNCQIDLDVPTEYLGCKVECPDCGHKFIIGNQPIRVPIPPQQPKKKSGGKKIPKWVFIVIPAALLFSIAAGFIVPMILIGDAEQLKQECQVANVTLTTSSDKLPPPQNKTRIVEWKERIPQFGKGLVISDNSFARFVDGEFNPPMTETYIAYPFKYPYQPWKNQEEVKFKVIANTTVDGLSAIIVQADIKRWKNRLRDKTFEMEAFHMTRSDERDKLERLIYLARLDFCIITDTMYAPEEELPAGLYIPFGKHLITTEAGDKKYVLLFAEDKECSRAFENSLQEKEAAVENRRPVLDEFLGIRFGEEVREDDDRFTFRKDLGRKGIEYAFTPANKFRNFNYYAVVVNPSTRTVFKIFAKDGKTPLSRRDFERRDIKAIVVAKYGIEGEDIKHGVKYQMKNKRHVYIYNNRGDVNAIMGDLYIEAVDANEEEKCKNDWDAAEPKRSAERKKQLKAEGSAL